MLRPANRLRYLFTLILLIAFASPAQAQFAGGDGSPENPFQIETIDQLSNINDFLDSNFILSNDIKMETVSGFSPIGSLEEPFTGTFDGNGKTLSELLIFDDFGEDNVGLFSVTSGARISNLRITVDRIIGRGDNVGALVGISDNGTEIESCTVEVAEGDIEPDPDNDIVFGAMEGVTNVGGIVGLNRNGSIISNSSSSLVQVAGKTNTGGLVGSNTTGSSITNSSSNIRSVFTQNNGGGLVGNNLNSSISGSFAEGGVYAGVNNAGGLVGLNESSTIADSYATSRVDGGGPVGGLVGSIIGADGNPSQIERSYGSGRLYGESSFSTGGLSGDSFGLVVLVTSFWGKESTGTDSAVGGDESGSNSFKISTEGLTGLTQTEMQQQASFVGFDFNSVWQINEGSSYPYLRNNLPDTPPFVEVIPEFAGGDGSPGNPYQIEVGEQLDNIRDFPDAHFELIDDIELGTFPYDIGEGWEPVGTASGFPQVPFTGTIDGNGFTISNLFIESNSSYNSLLGDTENCTVTDLNFENASVSGNQFIGILASQSEGCTFENISVDDAGLNALPKAFNIEADSLKNRVSGTAFVGGLVGYSISSTFDNIFVEAFVENTGSSTGGIIGVMLTSSSVSNSASAGVVEGGNNGTGGLVGENLTSSLISQSYSTSHVTGGNLYVGGLVGNNSNSGRITNSYALGSVVGSQQVGGLVGRNNAEVDSSYSAGQVIGVSSVGGLVGSNNGQTINSFWNVHTSGMGISIAGIAFSDASFKTQDSLSSFIDFTSIWTIDEGTSFPYLQSNTPLTPPSLGIPQIFAGGTGSMSDPFQISTIDHLSSVRNFPDSYFSLLNDLSFNASTDFIDETGWVPIGSFEFPFTKGFEGNGHTISNLFIDRQFFNYQGFFGYVEGASISNLILDSLDVSGQMLVGGLVGQLIDGSVENVSVSGSVGGLSEAGILIGKQENSSTNQSTSEGSVMGQNSLGGLIGASTNLSSTTNSSSSALVNGSSSIGGLIGYNDASEVSQSYSTSEVVGTNSNIGGLVGIVKASWVSESFYAGEGVTGDTNVGGLIGSSEPGTIVTDSYSIGPVTGFNLVGGFVGSASTSVLTSNYSAGLVTGVEIVGGFGGDIEGPQLSSLFWNVETAGYDISEFASGLNDSEFKNESSFTGFDFVSTWQIDENTSYPYLQNNAQNPAPVLDIPAFFSGGSGTEEDPYLVGTPDQLNNVRRFLNSWYQQISDIDMNVMPFNIEEGWNPIGTTDLRFKGEYDGDGFAIKNLFVNRPNTDHVGLFGYADSSTISNVHMQEVDIFGDNFTGALVGLLETSVLDSSSSSGIVNGAQRVGGLIGQTESTLISNSSSSAHVNAGNITGGLVGYHGRLSNSTSDAIISESYSTGKVDGNNWVGGLVAIVSSSSVTNSYSTADVEGDGIVAGLVGENTSDGILDNVYSSGSVTGNSNVGGLIGRDLATLTGGWWNTDSSGQATSDGGIGLTDAEMRMEASFTGFDFTNTWDITEDVTFPFLQGNTQTPGPGIPVVLPDTVILSSPADNALNVATSLNLEWTSTTDALSYHVQLSANDEFTSIISQDEDVSDLTFALNGLENLTTYYWRVRAENEFGFSEWSAEWAFTTTGVPPGQVVLVAPANLTADVEIEPTLIWNSLESTESYSLQLSNSDTFTDLLVDEAILSDTTYQVNDTANDKVNLTKSSGARPPILEGLTTYYWRVRASNEFGAGDWSTIWEFTTLLPVSNEDETDLPIEFSLLQNYPNPFNPTTQIEFQLPENAIVSLNIYDMLGRRVSTLVDQQMQSGTHTVSFNASNLSSGIYIYQLKAGNRIINKKMMLIK